LLLHPTAAAKLQVTHKTLFERGGNLEAVKLTYTNQQRDIICPCFSTLCFGLGSSLDKQTLASLTPVGKAFHI
jgi:hypothetical protein